MLYLSATDHASSLHKMERIQTRCAQQDESKRTESLVLHTSPWHAERRENEKTLLVSCGRTDRQHAAPGVGGGLGPATEVAQKNGSQDVTGVARFIIARGEEYRAVTKQLPILQRALTEHMNSERPWRRHAILTGHQ
jgi:hypothetical protein